MFFGETVKCPHSDDCRTISPPGTVNLDLAGLNAQLFGDHRRVECFAVDPKLDGIVVCHLLGRQQRFDTLQIRASVLRLFDIAIQIEHRVKVLRRC